MIDTKELRRLTQAATPGPDGVSLNWVKLLQDFQKEANPATVSDLLDRLEAAEYDALEQARLNGMGSEREAALMAKLGAAEKERDVLRDRLALESQENGALRDSVDRACEERDALRARIEQMEQQFPVCRVKDIKRAHYMTKVVGLDPDALLYLSPGAQPASITPEGWKLVPIEPTQEMKTAAIGVEVYQDSPPSTDCLTWEEAGAIYAAMLAAAAAPEAKP